MVFCNLIRDRTELVILQSSPALNNSFQSACLERHIYVLQMYVVTAE